MQIMGVLAKRVFPRAWGLHSPLTLSAGARTEASHRGGTSTIATSATGPPRGNGGVFQVAIALCYDKKLEASRKDFRHEKRFFPAAETAGDTPVREVDLVLTTTQVMELIEKHAAAHARAGRSNGNLVPTSGGFTFGADSMATTSNDPDDSSPPGEVPPTEEGVIPTDEEEPFSPENGPPRNKAPPDDPPENTPPRNTPTSETAASDDVAGTFFRSHPVADIAHPLEPGFPVGQAALSGDGLSLLGGVDGEGGAGGNSGGYLEHVFRYAAHQLFGREDLTGRRLVYREGRNPDFRETSLEVDGKVVLRFAYAYGFRNIPSILAKYRRGKCPYHFVEVMACPSGCVNGGGQIKFKKEGPRDTRQRVETVSDVLRKDLVSRAPQDNPLVQAVCRELLGGSAPGGPAARPFLHTTYHTVPKLEVSNPHMSPW